MATRRSEGGPLVRAAPLTNLPLGSVYVGQSRSLTAIVYNNNPLQASFAVKLIDEHKAEHLGDDEEKDPHAANDEQDMPLEVTASPAEVSLCSNSLLIQFGQRILF